MQKVVFYIFFFFFLFGLCWPLPGIQADGSLDKERLKTLYFDGEFIQVREALEHYRKQNSNLSDEDKIFIYKYLCVVYAADSNSRDKGESYMYQLLKLVPSVDLLDMYISDNIQAIFNKVRMEYEARNKSQPQGNSAAESTPPPWQRASSSSSSQKSKEKESHPSSSHKWVWWTVGGVAVAGTVAAFVVLGAEDPKPAPRKVITNTPN